MCLIIYSPDGNLPKRDDFKNAGSDNPDGIGVMSADGVEKFLGKRKTRRAYSYVQQLSRAGIPYAVHFRWATHGKIGRANTHPFEIPGTGAYMMHNGVLFTSQWATEEESDTAIFARDVMAMFPEPMGSKEYLDRVGKAADGNRLLIMRDEGRTFDIVNRGLWSNVGGLWFSNLYSFGDWPKMSSSGKKTWSSLAYYATADKTTRILANPYAKIPGNAGPTLTYNPDDDSDLWESWDEEYAYQVRAGADSEEAERLATLYVQDRVNRRNDARAAYQDPPKSGFDWHDSSTWAKYPIPGTVERALNRHGYGETPEEKAIVKANDTFI